MRGERRDELPVAPAGRAADEAQGGRVGGEHDERRAAVGDEAEQRRDRAPAGDAERLDLDADVAGVLAGGPNGGGERGREGLLRAPGAAAAPGPEHLGDDERRLHVGGGLDGDAGRVGLETRAPECCEDDGPAVAAGTAVAGSRTGAPAVGNEGHWFSCRGTAPPPWGAWPGAVRAGPGPRGRRAVRSPCRAWT